MVARRPRYYKLRRPRRARRAAKLSAPTARAVKKIVKKQMSNVLESKVLDVLNEPIPLNCFYHNSVYIMDADMCRCEQGVQDSDALNPPNRIGDSIFVKNVQLGLLITNFTNFPNLCYRITIVKIKNGNLAYTDPYFHPQLGNKLMNPVDTEAPECIKVIYDRRFNALAFQSSATPQAGDKKFLWNYNLKVNHKVKYDSGSANATGPTYRLFVTCYDTQATTTLSNVARFTYYRRTHFLDA